MNKETSQILDYIAQSGFYLDKFYQIRMKFNNIKDFQNQVNYVIMEIVNTEKKFLHLKRNNIELDIIAQTYF